MRRYVSVWFSFRASLRLPSVSLREGLRATASGAAGPDLHLRPEQHACGSEVWRVGLQGDAETGWGIGALVATVPISFPPIPVPPLSMHRRPL